MVTKKCPKCVRVAQVRMERTFKATEHKSHYSCAVCGATWTTLSRPDRKPSKRKFVWLA